MKLGFIARLKNLKNKQTKTPLEHDCQAYEPDHQSEIPNNTKMDLFSDETIAFQAQESIDLIPSDELFELIDTDHSGTIDKKEFEAMLAKLGFSVTATKAARVFRLCDLDNSGKIDRNELKKAIFMLKSVTGGSHILPTRLPAPRDVFQYFDEDGNGMVDEMEFADMLEYFGLEVSDLQKMALFRKYDRDKSGFIEYPEFRDIWLRLCDAREELLQRGVVVSPSNTTKQLRQMLEQRLAQEELTEDEREKASSLYFHKEQRKEFISLLGAQALHRAKQELEAALDAAGQVYVFGTGRLGRWELSSGTSQYVWGLWDSRIDPESFRSRVPELSVKQKAFSIKQQPAPPAPRAPLKKKTEAKPQRFVHRRPENVRWTFQSPPKLDTRSLSALRRYRSNVIAAGNEESEPQEVYEAPNDAPEPLLYRASNFQHVTVMNTSSLWGRQVVNGALGDDHALLVTSHGDVLEWGRDSSLQSASPKLLDQEDLLHGCQAVTSVAVNRMEAFALLRDGSLWAWKSTSPSPFSAPKQIHSLAHVSIQSLSASSSLNASITTNAELYTWISSSDAQATKMELPYAISNSQSVRFVSCGAAHCGLTTLDGKLFMWGCADGGRLGLGAEFHDYIAKPTLVEPLSKEGVRVRQVACGTAHSVLCTESYPVDWKSCQINRFFGGKLYACGSVLPLGKHMPTWEAVASKPNDIAFVQVSCGFAHSAAVSVSGALFTWGRNASGCTGHPVSRAFIPEPEAIDSIHKEPENLATGKLCRQISVYNQQGAHLALTDRISSCIHTQIEDMPWWEIDISEPVSINRICVWSCEEGPSTLYPFWVFVSQKPFQDTRGERGLQASKAQAIASKYFFSPENLMEWGLPWRSIGRYIRIQSQRRGFLRFGHIQVFGTHSAARVLGRVAQVHCGYNRTLVVLPPMAQSLLEAFYRRAVQADADNATILRDFRAYEEFYERMARGPDGAFENTERCELCEFSRGCEACALYDAFRGEYRTELPHRGTSDQSGLQVHLVAVSLYQEELQELSKGFHPLGAFGAIGTRAFLSGK
uniref:Regulator of chromosome condensation (RCC1) putative n=1 Tax=Albugo laibachii Nc14 TaxID=890382 RepID=F0VYP9_9STRA|nr:regulator of chromosome condensation (RCC1) putative [Albugo laibachii Nc14]|eukprot:CCA13913.1 regulator of chromosome condensation (RCC1) putative [Albugo laibachii Nc14]